MKTSRNAARRRSPRRNGLPLCIVLAALAMPLAPAAAEPESRQYYTVSSNPVSGMPPGEHLTGSVTVTCIKWPFETIKYQSPMRGNVIKPILLCSGPIRVTGEVWWTDRPDQVTACTPVPHHEPREGGWPNTNFVQLRSVEVVDDRIRCEMIAY